MNTRTITKISMLSALVVVAQVALAPLPNIEVVTLLLYIYALKLSLSDALWIGVIFSTLEMIIWGVGEWVIGYYWVWSLWIIIVYLLKNKIKSNYTWALVHCMWGLFFGLLFAINYGIFYGNEYLIAYWLRGIPFDITHAIANYLIALIVAPALNKAVYKIEGAIHERINN